MYNEETCHLVALSKLAGVGALTMKLLISYCGSAVDVFTTSEKDLSQIPSINKNVIGAILECDPLKNYESEIEFADKQNIQIISYLDQRYPERLKQLLDGPALLYYKGELDLNNTRMLSIIGTRKASQFAMSLTERIVGELQGFNINIISGLAYGIDIAAHRAAIKNNIPTLAVVAHGLDRVYPAVHRGTLDKMLQNGGGVLTEFPRGVIPHKERFPMRNRIVAGLSDAVLVVESGKSGGSMITTQYANDYNRDVLAIPGRAGDPLAGGSNYLIKSNMAALVESADDIIEFMNWKKKSNNGGIQKSLFVELSKDEQLVMDEFVEAEERTMDYLIHKLQKPSSQLAAILLPLEFKGVLKPLPGNRYMRV